MSSGCDFGEIIVRAYLLETNGILNYFTGAFIDLRFMNYCFHLPSTEVGIFCRGGHIRCQCLAHSKQTEYYCSSMRVKV